MKKTSLAALTTIVTGFFFLAPLMMWIGPKVPVLVGAPIVWVALYFSLQKIFEWAEEPDRL